MKAYPEGGLMAQSWVRLQDSLRLTSSGKLRLACVCVAVVFVPFGTVAAVTVLWWLWDLKRHGFAC